MFECNIFFHVLIILLSFGLIKMGCACSKKGVAIIPTGVTSRTGVVHHNGYAVNLSRTDHRQQYVSYRGQYSSRYDQHHHLYFQNEKVRERDKGTVQRLTQPNVRTISREEFTRLIEQNLDDATVVNLLREHERRTNGGHRSSGKAGTSRHRENSRGPHRPSSRRGIQQPSHPTVIEGHLVLELHQRQALERLEAKTFRTIAERRRNREMSQRELLLLLREYRERQLCIINGRPYEPPRKTEKNTELKGRRKKGKYEPEVDPYIEYLGLLEQGRSDEDNDQADDVTSQEDSESFLKKLQTGSNPGVPEEEASRIILEHLDDPQRLRRLKEIERRRLEEKLKKRLGGNEGVVGSRPESGNSGSDRSHSKELLRERFEEAVEEIEEEEEKALSELEDETLLKVKEKKECDEISEEDLMELLEEHRRKQREIVKLKQRERLKALEKAKLKLKITKKKAADGEGDGTDSDDLDDSSSHSFDSTRGDTDSLYSEATSDTDDDQVQNTTEENRAFAQEVLDDPTSDDFTELVKRHLKDRDGLKKLKEQEKRRLDDKLKERLGGKRTVSSRPESRNSDLSDHSDSAIELDEDVQEKLDEEESQALAALGADTLRDITERGRGEGEVTESELQRLLEEHRRKQREIVQRKEIERLREMRKMKLKLERKRSKAKMEEESENESSDLDNDTQSVRSETGSAASESNGFGREMGTQADDEELQKLSKEDEEFVNDLLLSSKSDQSSEEDFSELVKKHLQDREKLKLLKNHEKKGLDDKLKERLRKRDRADSSRPGSRSSVRSVGSDARSIVSSRQESRNSSILVQNDFSDVESDDGQLEKRLEHEEQEELEKAKDEFISTAYEKRREGVSEEEWEGLLKEYRGKQADIIQSKQAERRKQDDKMKAKLREKLRKKNQGKENSAPVTDETVLMKCYDDLQEIFNNDTQHKEKMEMVKGVMEDYGKRKRKKGNRAGPEIEDEHKKRAEELVKNHNEQIKTVQKIRGKEKEKTVHNLKHKLKRKRKVAPANSGDKEKADVAKAKKTVAKDEQNVSKGGETVVATVANTEESDVAIEETPVAKRGDIVTSRQVTMEIEDPQQGDEDVTSLVINVKTKDMTSDEVDDVTKENKAMTSQSTDDITVEEYDVEEVL